MKIGIVFASTEGQTLKICQFVQAQLLEAGHSSALISADAAVGLHLMDFDGVILAASVHVGRYQSSFVEFIVANLDQLMTCPTLFLSVSLAAAGDDKEDWIELSHIVHRLQTETGWTPGRVEQVAGAFRFTHYGLLKYWALRWIEAKKDPDAVPGEDKEYTDWEKLRVVIGDWTDGLPTGT